MAIAAGAFLLRTISVSFARKILLPFNPLSETIFPPWNVLI